MGRLCEEDSSRTHPFSFLLSFPPTLRVFLVSSDPLLQSPKSPFAHTRPVSIGRLRNSRLRLVSPSSFPGRCLPSIPSGLAFSLLGGAISFSTAHLCRSRALPRRLSASLRTRLASSTSNAKLCTEEAPGRSSSTSFSSFRRGVWAW
jgi:hypothetical protein